MMQRLGFLDWGIGGIGIFQAFRRRRSDVPVFYWSDTGATPYGRLPASALTARVRRVLQVMVGQGVTQVVVACNAASTILPGLGDVGIPVMGVIEPAIAMVSPALEGILGVVGGARTIRSGLYRRALATQRRRVIQRIAQPLSAHIEAGRVGTPAFERDLRRILGPLARANAILLACTHYPSAAGAFARLAPRASLLDPAEAVVKTLLARWRLPRGRGDLFVTTGRPDEMRRAALTAWAIDLGPCLRTPDPDLRRRDRRRR
jgi:glutamate racemase